HRWPACGQLNLRALHSAVYVTSAHVQSTRRAPVVERLQPHGDRVGGQQTNQVVELRDAGAARDVGRYGQIRLAAQNIVDEGRQVAAWADLHKQAYTVAIHRFDRSAELDRPDPVLVRERTSAGKVGWVGGNAGAGIERHLRRRDDPAVHDLAQRLGIGRVE